MTSKKPVHYGQNVLVMSFLMNCILAIDLAEKLMKIRKVIKIEQNLNMLNFFQIHFI